MDQRNWNWQLDRVIFYVSRPLDSRRVARLDGRKAFAARVESHVDGRGCSLLDDVLLFKATDRPRS